MNQLHSHNPPILHRDLKSPNILLVSHTATDAVVAKIADFGLAHAGNEARRRGVANPVWLAPEILRKQSYDRKVGLFLTQG